MELGGALRPVGRLVSMIGAKGHASYETQATQNMARCCLFPFRDASSSHHQSGCGWWLTEAQRSPPVNPSRSGPDQGNTSSIPRGRSSNQGDLQIAANPVIADRSTSSPGALPIRRTVRWPGPCGVHENRPALRNQAGNAKTSVQASRQPPGLLSEGKPGARPHPLGARA